MRPLTSTLALAAVMIVGLTACAPGEPSPTKRPSPSASASPTTTPTTEPPVADEATPVTIGCSELVTPEALYAFNPNYGLQAEFAPAEGTVAATMVAQGGVACSWLNQTSNDTIVVSVAQPTKATLADVRAEAEAGQTISGLGDAAFFAQAGGAGTVTVFSGPLWISGTSVTFVSADDARPMIDAALEGLGH